MEKFNFKMVIHSIKLFEINEIIKIFRSEIYQCAMFNLK